MIAEFSEYVVVFLSSHLFFLSLLVFFFLMILWNLIDRFLVQKIKAKHARSNMGMLMHSAKYGTVVGLLFFLIGTHLSPSTDYSVVIGFVSAALGFALQKPITGVAAWLFIAIKRPFHIGDRIIVGDVKGDVIDINLSHIIIHEVGGTITSEDRSGRIIHVPTRVLFDSNIVNYTLNDEFVLDEITILITYESNLEKAEYIIQKSSNQVLNALNEVHKQPPYVRLFFDDSGINIKVRYFVSAPKRQEISSDIIRLIHEGFNREPDVEIAYPHVQIIRNDAAPEEPKKKKRVKKRRKR